MATLTITNVSTDPVSISDIYRTLASGEAVSVTRYANQVPQMASLQKQVAAGNVTLSIAYSADELASGLAVPSAAVEGKDMAPVAATTAQGGLFVIRKIFTAGAGGSADDVTVYAVNALPEKFRVVDCHAFVSTAVSGSSLTVRTAASGGGTLLATVAAAATGRGTMTGTATAVATPGSSAGLFVHRSDSGIAGEVILICRPEN